MGGFEGLLHDTGQVISDRVQVHGVLQPGRERHHGLVGVVPGSIEPSVHHPLHPPPHRIEQSRRGQRRGGHRHRSMKPMLTGSAKMPIAASPSTRVHKPVRLPIHTRAIP